MVGAFLKGPSGQFSLVGNNILNENWRNQKSKEETILAFRVFDVVSYWRNCPIGSKYVVRMLIQF